MSAKRKFVRALKHKQILIELKKTHNSSKINRISEENVYSNVYFIFIFLHKLYNSVSYKMYNKLITDFMYNNHIILWNLDSVYSNRFNFCV